MSKRANNAGVKNFDKFHNSGYKGLYNGETANDIDILEVIAKNRGTMPENLPTPKKSLKQLDKENVKSLLKNS